MLERIISLSIRYRWMVLAWARMRTLVGVWSFQR